MRTDEPLAQVLDLFREAARTLEAGGADQETIAELLKALVPMLVDVLLLEVKVEGLERQVRERMKAH